MARRLLLPLMIAGLAGCAEYWAKPGGTPAEFGAVRETCRRAAEAQFPPEMEPATIASGTPAPTVTRCAPAGAGVACSTTGVGFNPPSTTTLDRAIGPREQAIRACLAEAGWTSVRSQAEADAITGTPQ